MPKGIVRDSGINHYLTGIDARDKLLRAPQVGQNFESFVTEEVIRGIQATMVTRWDYFYYRTKNRVEIDLILAESFGILPIEIKFGCQTAMQQLRPLQQFVQQHDLPFGIIINNSNQVRLLSEKIIQLPAGCLGEPSPTACCRRLTRIFHLRVASICYVWHKSNMTDSHVIAATLRAIRASLDLTQAQLAERLGVSFASVNRWEGGAILPQKAAREAIAALAVEAGVDAMEAAVEPAEAAARVTRRRTGGARNTTTGRRRSVPSTKPMEQMLWDAACSIRGEKDAPKFKDYLLPLLFLKRLSDVFEDEITRLSEEYGDPGIAREIAENDHDILRFYLPPESHWSILSGREDYDWPQANAGRSMRPHDIGQHLTRAVRAVVRYNPSLSGVIDVKDFAAESNGEREINPAKLATVVETFSDARYRLGLADVQPDFLGRAYEYLLRKFAEGSGQSAGEFFTPTEVGSLMAHILRPRAGEACHDYACGSAGLLVKLQLVARELDPTSRVPLKLCGQELQADSYAVAYMNAIIHDMEVEIARGDTMLNPKFKTAAGKISTHDIVVANPMWNQLFNPDLFTNDPFDRFRTTGGVTSGKGDWAWLQHTLACLNERGRAAVVLDTGAVTRGSGAKYEDRERNIRKWFVEHDLIDGVILLPGNLFYNTSAAGVIVVLSKRKPEARKDKIVILNASRRVKKGRPKNFVPEEDIRPLAAAFLKGAPVEGEIAVITREQAEKADYNLSPNRWVGQTDAVPQRLLKDIIAEIQRLENESHEIAESITKLLSRVAGAQ